MRWVAAALLVLALAKTARAEGKAPAQLRIGLEELSVAGVPQAYADAVEERVCAAVRAYGAGAAVACHSDVVAAAAGSEEEGATPGECRSEECRSRIEAIRTANVHVSGSLELGASGIVLSLRTSYPNGMEVQVSGRLPEDLAAMRSRVPAIVRKLFP